MMKKVIWKGFYYGSGKILIKIRKKLFLRLKSEKKCCTLRADVYATGGISR